jgi:glycosyltransferase involved in cell wall biosynthesis
MTANAAMHAHISPPLLPVHSIDRAVAPVAWHAPLRDPSGYAEEARHFLFALSATGIQAAARAIRWSDRETTLPPARERLLLRLQALPTQPNSIHVWHILAPYFNALPDARANIGRTMFETDRLPDGWAAACNRMDAIWVPSEFNRESFARAGVCAQKLRVVPGTIDFAAYDPGCEPLQIDGARGFNFLSVFDWTLRKGWDVLIRAFVEEFGPDDDAALIFKVHSSLGYSAQQILESVSAFISNTLGRDPDSVGDIVFLDANLSDSQMPALYRAADCFVLPSRGEGWGRPYMEAMTMCLPVIGTAWSGNTAFMTRHNSLLLDCDVVDVPEAGWMETPTYRGHRWAEPCVCHLRKLMRVAFEDRSAGRETGERARADLERRFSYCAVGELIAQELAGMCGK